MANNVSSSRGEISSPRRISQDTGQLSFGFGPAGLGSSTAAGNSDRQHADTSSPAEGSDAAVAVADAVAVAESEQDMTARKKTDASKASPAKSSKRGPNRRTAEYMAKQQREISISEFFAKNRHLLGFDNKRKALLTSVKEAVDNSLDACEEAGILPDLFVGLKQMDEDRFRVTVRDNGPGIVKAQIPNIFGKLLYGSKFHRLKMSRGQQGIGISAAGMYGLLTTGKAIRVISRTAPNKDAHRYEIQIDTKRNKPEIVADEKVEVDWAHGTEVIIDLVGAYTKGRTSVDEYIEQTAIANPHASILYAPPVGDRIEFPRGTDDLPHEPREIKPHPYGIELGMLMKMVKDTKAKQLGDFLQQEFSRVSQQKAGEIAAKAGLTARTWLANVNGPETERLYRAIQETKLMAPRTDCLAPIGAQTILAGLLKGVQAEFFTATTRPPAVYRGNPFQIEVGLAFGGQLPHDQLAKVIRFANRVPLLYQQSHCCSYRSVLETNWRAYGLHQSAGSAPSGPLVIMLHMASVWVPFTSESKEAVADYDEIRKEIKLALQECGRKLSAYVRRRARQKREGERRSVFERYIPEVVAAVRSITRVNTDQLRRDLMATAKKITEEADVEFDENGKPIKPKKEKTFEAENTVVVDREENPDATTQALIELGEDEPDDAPSKPKRASKKRGAKGRGGKGRKKGARRA